MAGEGTKTKRDDHQETSSKGNMNKVSNQETETAVSRAAVWKKSTLPSVLMQYGMQNQRKKKRRSPSRSKKVNAFDDDDMDEREIERNKQKQDHYMEVYDDIHRLRDYYYEAYMTALRQKIDKQRKQIKQKTEEMENRCLRKQLKEKAAVKEKVELKDNREFLKTLPKSFFYKVIGLQDKMTAEGKLKTQEDKDEFWKKMKDPETFNEHFGQPQLNSNTNSQYTGSMDRLSQISSTGPLPSRPRQSTDHGQHQSDFRPMSQIEESKEPSRPQTQEQQAWAITQMVQHQNKKPADPYTKAKQAAQALDKKCPQMELPELACFNMDLGEKPPDPEKVLEEMETKQREHERRSFVKRMRRMYQLSLSNQASAQRIMDKHQDELELALFGSLVADRSPGAEDVPAPPEDRVHPDTRPWLRHLSGRRILPIEEEGESMYTQSSKIREESSVSAGTGKSRSSKSSRPEPAPVPLTIDGVLERSNTMETTCMSTMWTNYMKAGKSAYVN